MERAIPLKKRFLLWGDHVFRIHHVHSSSSKSLPYQSTPLLKSINCGSTFILLVFYLSFNSLISSIHVHAINVSPTWRAFHGAAIVDTSMIIFGGTTDPSVDPFGLNSTGSNDIWSWSTTLRQWTQPSAQFAPGSGTTSTKSPNPQKFLSSVSLQSQGRALSYVSNSTTGSTQGNLLVLDTNFWTWSIPSSPNSAVAPLSRLGAAVGISSNTVFIHGGAEVTKMDGYPSTIALNDLTKLDGSTFEWTSIANGPALMYHTMCKVPGLNKMIIFGGTDSSGTVFNDVHTFDLDREVWTLKIPVTAGNGGGIPSVRKGHSAVCLNNTMVIIGGGVDRPQDDDIWVLDAANWTWNRIDANKQLGPGPRTGQSALLNGTNILVWGGYGAPLANDTNLYILDTLAWQWSSSRDSPFATPIPGSHLPEGANSKSGNNSNVVIIGVVCSILALVAGLIGFLLFKRRGSRKGKSDVVRSPDNQSYLSDAERHLSRDVDLDDKPNYYHHNSGRDSGSSFGGWPAVVSRKSIPAQDIPLRSLSSVSQQATTDANSNNDNKNINKQDASRSIDVSTGLQQPRPITLASDQTSQKNVAGGGSYNSDPFYPAYLAENDEEDADRWTFASSLSFDQRERSGSIPALRYIPSRGGSAPLVLQRSVVQSSGSLSPSFSATRGPKKGASTSSILSGGGSVNGSPSLAAFSTAPMVSQPLGRDGSITHRDAALFTAVSPLDRVSLMCSGLDVDSQPSGDDEGRPAKYLHPLSRFPQWQENYRRDGFVGSTLDEEEEENVAHHRTDSVSTINSTVPANTDHPALTTLIQNLPARYVVSKIPSPIHGSRNDILFAVDSDTQQPIVIKSFSRKEAWERECRTLRRLRGPCVVELKHLATLVLSETDESNKPSSVRLVVLERLDETLAQMLKNARRAKKLALREQFANSSSITEARALDLSGAGLYSSGPVLDERYVKDIVKGVLRCLTWCHSKKVVYCDLKPTNIMRNRDDPRQQWKLIDMESSRTEGEERTCVSTTRYCSPEIAVAAISNSSSFSEIGVTAQYGMDLWSFGCLLYELYATRPLIPQSAKDEEILHFLANPSPDTQALSNGLRWINSNELDIPYFEQAVKDKNARQLIRILLNPDPKSRATMDQVLNSSYLSGSIEERTTSSIST